jgi:sec-independent protein translocase protein TatA
MFGIGPWELVLILAIVLVIFGAKRLKSLGSDLGGAIKSFKSSMKDEEDKDKSESANADTTKQVSNQSDKKH